MLCIFHLCLYLTFIYFLRQAAKAVTSCLSTRPFSLCCSFTQLSSHFSPPCISRLPSLSIPCLSLSFYVYFIVTIIPTSGLRILLFETKDRTRYGSLCVQMRLPCISIKEQYWFNCMYCTSRAAPWLCLLSPTPLIQSDTVHISPIMFYLQCSRLKK